MEVYYATFFVNLLLLAVPALCSAEIYKWVDEKGQTGYSDDLGKVPEKYRDNAVIAEKEEQAVEIIEKSEPEKSPKKGAEGKEEPEKDFKGQERIKRSLLLTARPGKSGNRILPARNMR